MIQKGQLLAVFNSAHRVMKAENVLKKAGLAILLIPAPRAISTDCGLAIRFDDVLYERVMQILSSEKVLPDTVYRKESDINFTSVWNFNNGAAQVIA